MKMEQTGCSETSAYKIQRPGNYPEENIERTEHGESLKSRNIFYYWAADVGINFVNKSDHQFTVDIHSVSEIGGCVLDPCYMELVILTNVSDINTQGKAVYIAIINTNVPRMICIVIATSKSIQCACKTFYSMY